MLQSQRTTGGLRAKLERLKSTVTALSTAYLAVSQAIRQMTRAVRALVAGLVGLIDKGGQFIQVGRAFNRLAGDQTAALSRLRTATFGLIDNYDLMIGFNRALTLGASKTTVEFAGLANTAVKLGRALGVDAAFAMESLSLGIGRQSRLILDNLGIIVKVEQANKDYARALRINVKELTLNQQKEAFRVAALAAAEKTVNALGDTMFDASDALTEMRVAWANLVRVIGAFLAKSPKLRAFLLDITEAIKNFTATLSGTGDDIKAAFGDLGAIAGNAFIIAFVKVLDVLADVFRGIADRLAGLIINIPGIPIFNPFGAFAGAIRMVADFAAQLDVSTTAADNLDAALARLAARGAPFRGGGDTGAERLANFARTLEPKVKPIGDTSFRGLGTTAAPTERGLFRLRAAQVRFLRANFKQELDGTMRRIGEDLGSTLASGIFDGFKNMMERLGGFFQRVLSNVLGRFLGAAIGGAIGGPAGAAIGGGTGGSFQQVAGAGLTNIDLSGMPPAQDPRQSARDAEWLGFLSDSLNNATANGAVV